jgi:hypothetical protein
MFCPHCGKDNSFEQKFCATCGTNLEAVAQALTGKEEDFFTKIDTGIDFFVARYTEHVFQKAPQGVTDHKVSKSWQLLGQAIVTTFVDILLFTLMWNILPLRFLILCISTPFRLLAERENSPSLPPSSNDDYKAPQLAAQTSGRWLQDIPPSVIENTTKHLDAVAVTEIRPTVTTDKLL